MNAGRAMKKIGIVGGVGWPSTVDYYAGLCRRSERRHRALGLRGPAPMPEMAIESLDVRRAIELLGDAGDEASWTLFDDYHRAALRRLEASGAALAVIASNTPHDRLEKIARGVAIPVVDLVEAAARACAGLGATRVLLLGTAVTMDSARFRAGFARWGIEAAAPDDAALRAQVAALIAELQAGVDDDAGGRLRRIVRAASGGVADAPPVACLACTELPLAFPAHADEAVFELDGVAWVNTAAAHVDAAFALAVGVHADASRGDAAGVAALPHVRRRSS
jgi:aspartate racemase